MAVTLFNPGRVAVVCNSSGRVIGAGEWLDDVDPDDPVTAALIGDGSLLQGEDTAEAQTAPAAGGSTPTADGATDSGEAGEG